MFPPNWHRVKENRPPPPSKYCERCGEILELDPDFVADRPFREKRKTRCATDLIDEAAECLLNEEV